MRIITGCSRSGTSFISQAVHHLGGDFGAPEDLIDADRWNEKGYFENRAVNTLNHKLLFGPWSNPRLWIDIMWPRNPWIHIRKLATIAQGPVLSRPSLIRQRGRKLMGELTSLGKSLEGKVAKDPRFSYLMEPWVESGTVHSVLYVLRHPTEAARSMSKQTKLPLKLTYMGWLDAIEKFWNEPPGVPVHIVDYNAFFDPEKREREMRTLSEFLGGDHSQASLDEIVDKVLDKRLRTQDRSSEDLPKKIRDAYNSVLERKPS